MTGHLHMLIFNIQQIGANSSYSNSVIVVIRYVTTLRTVHKTSQRPLEEVHILMQQVIVLLVLAVPVLLLLDT
jgi:hypothetical protein